MTSNDCINASSASPAKLSLMDADKPLMLAALREGTFRMIRATRSRVAAESARNSEASPLMAIGALFNQIEAESHDEVITEAVYAAIQRRAAGCIGVKYHPVVEAAFRVGIRCTVESIELVLCEELKANRPITWDKVNILLDLFDNPTDDRLFAPRVYRQVERDLNARYRLYNRFQAFVTARPAAHKATAN